MLSKIKWDPNENPEEYEIFYYDRIEKKNKKIKFTEIKRFDKSFLYLSSEGKEIVVPLHRIREVRRGCKLIWKKST